MCLCTVLLEFDLSFCRGGVWCMQDYVSIMSLPLYFVLRMSSCALVFLVYNKWSLECFCDLPQSASISPKTLQNQHPIFLSELEVKVTV